MNRYLTLPLELNKLHKKSEHTTCSLKQSVAQNLHLIITTAFGELVSDFNFGTSIWDTDFSNANFNSQQKEQILESLKRAIHTYERRVENVKIGIGIEQDELQNNKASRMKKKMSIRVNAVLKLTNEPIVYNDSFFISPLSYN